MTHLWCHQQYVFKKLKNNGYISEEEFLILCNKLNFLEILPTIEIYEEQISKYIKGLISIVDFKLFFHNNKELRNNMLRNIMHKKITRNIILLEKYGNINECKLLYFIFKQISALEINKVLHFNNLAKINSSIIIDIITYYQNRGFSIFSEILNNYSEILS